MNGEATAEIDVSMPCKGSILVGIRPHKARRDKNSVVDPSYHYARHVYYNKEVWRA